jgi:hypothetical protein
MHSEASSASREPTEEAVEGRRGSGECTSRFEMLIRAVPAEPWEESDLRLRGGPMLPVEASSSVDDAGDAVREWAKGEGFGSDVDMRPAGRR